MKGLLLIGRDLGDAIISLGFLEACAQRLPDVEWHVWCRPQAAFLFKNLPQVRSVYENQFPMGADWQFGPLACASLLLRLPQLYLQRFDFSVDLLGDFREILLARFAGSRRHFSPIWPAGHPFSILLDKGLPDFVNAFAHRLIQTPLHVRPEQDSVYATYNEMSDLLVTSLSSSNPLQPYRPPERKKPHTLNAAPIIGIHPFASKPSKLWIPENWIQLVGRLQNAGIRVIVYGAPHEREELSRMFAGKVRENEFRTRGLADFLMSMDELEVLVGLDSFAVHVAYRAGIGVVVLNGANHPRLWAPPGSAVVRTDGLCPYQPCFNFPRCENSPIEYICMRSVSVEMVYAAVLEKLRLQQTDWKPQLN